MQIVHITHYCLAAIICWVITGTAAGYAVFSHRINDSLLERIGLSLIALTSASVVNYLWKFGWISSAGFYLSMSFAIYVIAVTWKHWRRYVRGEPPEDGGKKR